MKITTKTKATALLNDTNKVETYSNSRFTWHGSVAHYVGRDVEVSEDVQALFVERRQDASGPYARLMCVIKK